MNSATMPLYKRLNWTNTLFLVISPLIVVLFLPIEFITKGFDFKLFTLFLIGCFVTSISITGGYHRLFAHRSYQTNQFMKLFYLVFGAAALQGSVLKWCTDHRRHHRNVDTESDPYTIKKGFFYAHIGWVFLKDDPRYEGKFDKDLLKDPLIVWQHKYYVPIAIVVGFVVPLLVGWIMGNPWGGLLFGGFARVVLTHHCTFFINSLCHMWGSKPYSDEISARDNFVLAFFTYGEGYHNFHHKFEADYRNGIRWYHWDPTKWFIKFLAFFGFAKNLRKMPETEILKARIRLQEMKLKQKGRYDEGLQVLKDKLEEAHSKFYQLKKSYAQMKKDFSSQHSERLEQLKLEMRIAKIEFRKTLNQWRTICKFYERVQV